MSRLELGMAWRYMRSRRGSRLLSLISVIAVAGVVVGVSALIVVIGVMSGMQRDLRDKILMASPDIRVLPYGADMVMSDWRKTLAKVRSDPGVVAAAPFVIVNGIVTPRSMFVTPVVVIGLPQADSGREVTKIRETATAGDFSFATEGGRNGAVLGQRLAQTLSATPGITTVDVITVDRKKMDPVTGVPGYHVETFLVTGIFQTGMYEYDNVFMFTSLEAAQRLGGLDSLVTGIEVRTPSREEARGVARRLQDSLGFGDIRTEDWQSQNSALFEALKLEKKGMALILTLIILVAAFNIVGTLSMVVADKTREIGILRAMGMTAASIRRVFFAQGMIIGAAGTLGGAVLGLVVSFVVDHWGLIKIDSSVYFIDHLPVATEWKDVAMIIAASMVIAALATLYPARQAAELYPVEAIRHE